MKHIDVSYVDLANIAEIILKAGTIVSDEKKYILGFSQHCGFPIILTLSDERQPSNIYINLNLDSITTPIISYYMEHGIYCRIDRPSPFESRNETSITLYSLE